MRKIYAIGASNVRRMLRERSNIFFVFIFPIALILLIGAQFGGDFAPGVGIYQADDDPLATAISDVSVEPIVELDEILRIQDAINEVHVSPLVHRYITTLGQATRGLDGSPPDIRDWVLVGASPRSAQHVLALARVVAFWEKRDFVLPEDVKVIAVEALHRLGRTSQAQTRGRALLNRFPTSIYRERVQRLLDESP